MRKIALALFALALVTPLAHADSGIVTKASKRSVKDTIDCLETTLGAKGLTIFARVDHAGGATKAGLSLGPTELLIFGNPKMGTHLMTSNPTAGLDLPMKALAWQDADGKVWLSYNDPAYVAGRHGVADRAEIIKKMTGALGKFSDKATAGEC